MTISSTTRKAGPYIGNGTASVFPFAFKVFQASDVEVVRLNVSTNVETTLALTTDYTVSLNQDQDSNPGGSITLVAGALATGFNLVITSDVENLQPTDLTNQGGFYPDVINDALDRATIQIQQLQEGLDRAALLPITSSEDAAALVADIVRLADSADNLDIDANNIGSINTVATNIANVNTTASNIASVNTAAGSIANINTTAASIANVNAVGSDLLEPVSEINTVATSITNVNTVGDNIANVNTVAGNNSNVTTVAGSIANVNTVGGAIANVNVTAANIANVNAVGSDLLEPVSEINTVATDIANVNTVGTNISNVNTVAGINANVTTVAGISSNVTTVATNNANVTTVATNIANVNAVAGNNANVTAVAGNATNINAVAGNATNINAVNANSANINTVAGSNTAVTTVATNITAVNSAYTNLAAILDAPTQAANAANSAAQAAASAASGMYSAVQDKSANYTIVAADAGDLIRVTTTSGAITITLPLIGSTGIADGFKIAIVKWTADANAVNIARSGSDTINGATSAQIGSQYSQIILVADAETSTWFASQSGLGATNINIDTFSGNGSTTAFTLTSDPSTKNNTAVYISGVYQQKSTYSVSGTTLTFSTAPPSGTANIEVAYSTPLAIGTPSDGTVTAAKLATTGTPDTTKFLRGDMSWQVVAVTPTAVSDQANSSTGYFDLPAGTTAQRPASPGLGNFRYNSDRKCVEFYDGSAWGCVKSFKKTTGGIVVEYPTYRLHAFFGSGTFYTDSNVTADIAVVGGGAGGGGLYGDQDTGKGGGGAGGVVYKTGHSLTTGSYTIVVGAGGSGYPRGFGYNKAGEPGQASTAFGVTANGGGGGGSSDNGPGPASGGCGGGAGSRNSNTSLNYGASSNQGTYSGWTSAGNAGGNSGAVVGGTGGNFGGGGGGGAGGVGQAGQAVNNNSLGGNGGAGIDLSSIFGTDFGQGGVFAGGGGGGCYSTASVLSQSSGGTGGGGNGTSAKEASTGGGYNTTGINGWPNTGGGGGGSSEDANQRWMEGSASGNGGSGIVLVKVYL